MRRSAALVCAALVGVFGTVAFAAEPGDGIIRRGEGALRQELNKTELKPFDASLWGKLSDWKNGPALSDAQASGHPVLVLCWTDYIPTSKRAFALAKRIAEKYGPDGLIVVAAHSKSDWEHAQKPEAPKGATLLIALDAKEEFRAGLKSAGDPDFFVIDKAGQMRFASVDTSSVEAAVEKVVKESREDAASINGKLANMAQEREAAARRTEANRANVDLTNLPEVDFDLPPDTAYADKSLWPVKPKDDNSFNNQQDAQVKIPIPDTGYVSGSKPPTKGRVVVLYYWGLDARESYPSIDRLSLLQRQHGRDLTVIGVISPLHDDNNRQFNSNPGQDDAKALEARVRGILGSRNLNHSMLLDPNGALIGQGIPGSVNAQNTVFPLVSVISSDGVLRGWGALDSAPVKAALDKVLDNDPGVKARRKAEEAYIRAHDVK